MRGKGIALLSLILVLFLAIGVYFTAFNPVTQYIREGLDLKGGVHVVLQATKPTTQADMKKVQTIIQFRANSFGVSSPVVQIQGNNQISVQLPGVKNQAQAVKTIGQTAQLTFKDPKGKVVLSGTDVKSAQAALLSTGNVPVVNLTLKPSGAKAFAAATKALCCWQQGMPRPPHEISIYLDKQLISAPVVQAVISDGNAQISGIGSLKAAQHLASLINSGALPVPLKLIDVNRVSPTLGAASIHASEIAGLVAMVLIGLFMLIFYRFAGFLADMALAFYLMLLVAILIKIGAVITLPGVAGMILSAGIAVDANVIIFARIRDELRNGRRIGAAIEHGYKNGLRAILDSNVSTVIAAVVLYFFGSGDVRGFAVTLGLGVAISYFTAVVFTRYLLRMAEDSALVRNLKLFLGGV